jgi:hypothetical protein
MQMLTTHRLPAWASAALIALLTCGCSLLLAPIASATDSTWHVEPLAAPRGALSDVSCTSGSQCLAVGESFQGSSTVDGLVESWNGELWTPTTIPGLTFYGDSCLSATDCLAVGGSDILGTGIRAEIYHWTGASWEQQSAPLKPVASVLTSVSCATENDCVTVGTAVTDDGLNSDGILDAWNGTEWAHQITLPGGAGALSGVSCTPTGFCVAVGYGIGRNGSRQVILTRSVPDGRWREPNPRIEVRDTLYGVSCVSSSFCIAVGDVDTSHGGLRNRAVIESWDGQGWHRQQVSVPPRSSLRSVSCASTTSCVATGQVFAAGPLSRPQGLLVERWNGRNWSSEHVPSRSSYELPGIACVTGAGCVAAGAQGNVAGLRELVERYPENQLPRLIVAQQFR